MSEVLTVSEVARELGVAADTIRRWADAGLLPSVRTAAGARIFQRADVDRIREAREERRAAAGVR